MKVSEFLREYQISGLVPETPPDDAMVPFWAGWLLGHQLRVSTDPEHSFDTAIKAAEFIEEHAKG
jgi:hypothetical protein